MKTPEERRAWLNDPIFEAIYSNAMGVGGDGDALVKCREKYRDDNYIYYADGFEKYITEKHDCIKVERFRDENHKFVAYEGIEKGKFPFTRHEHERDGIKMVVFCMTPETGFVFRKGTSELANDDWSDIIITV